MLAHRVLRPLWSSSRASVTRYYSTPTTVKDATMDIIAELESEDMANTPPQPPPGAYPPPRRNPMSENRRKAERPAIPSFIKPVYRLCFKSTPNNTIATLTKPDGGAIAWFSGGLLGFRGVNRSGFEAGYQCTVKMFQRILDEAKDKPIELEIFLKGHGLGRDALIKALSSTEGDVVRPMVTKITDRTPIKIGGTRAKKARRL